MAITLPDGFVPIGVFGSAEIAPEKILGSDEWVTIVENNNYLWSAVNRRRFFDFADIDSPIKISGFTPVTEWVTLVRARVKLAEGRDAIELYCDYDDGQLALHLWHPSALQDIIAIIAAGTGYTVGDTLTVKGGTFVSAATINVDSISGGGGTGPIATASFLTGGEYSALPRSAVVDVRGGTVASAGTGYSVSDVLTLVGGTGTAATYTVATLSGSEVATVTLTTRGDYTVLPETDRRHVTTVAPAGGTGCELEPWWGNANQIYSTVSGGTGSGAVFAVSPRIVSPVATSTISSRGQTTLAVSSLSATELDVLVEGRVGVLLTDLKVYALRCRERSIDVGDL